MHSLSELRLASGACVRRTSFLSYHLTSDTVSDKHSCHELGTLKLEADHSILVTSYHRRNCLKTQGISCKCSFGQIVFAEEGDRDLFIEDPPLYHTKSNSHFLHQTLNLLLGWMADGNCKWVKYASPLSTILRCDWVSLGTREIFVIFFCLPRIASFPLSKRLLNLHNAEKYLCTQRKVDDNEQTFLPPFYQIKAH